MKIIIHFILIVIVFSSCSLQKSVPLSSELKKQISMLPSDPVALGYINVHQILNSSVYKLLQNEAAVDPFGNKAYKDFVEKTGFDLLENMREMLFAADYSTADNTRGIFVALGNFDAQKIIEYIEKADTDKKFSESNYDSFTLLSDEEDNFTICFADSNHFVGGDQTLVRNWLELFSGKKTQAENNTQLFQRIEILASRESMWIVMKAGTLIETVEREGIGLATGLKNIQNTDIALNMDETLEIYSRITCSDPEKASLVNDAIRGFVSSAKLTVSDDREAVDVLNKIDVSTQGNIVTGTMKLDQEEIKKLLQKRHILRKIEAV